MKNLEEVKDSLEDKVTDVNILFLDVSGTCTGYSVANVDFEKKKANFKSSGAIWFNKEWSHQQKYHYLGSAITNYFWVLEKVDYIVLEQYSINPKKRMGLLVVPEMCGAVKAFAFEHGIDVDSMLPQSWRSEMQIKKDAKGSYKETTKDKILELTSIPEESVSNITGNLRKTPSDVYDSLGLGCGWLKRLGFDKISFNNLEVNKHVGALDLV